VHQNAAGGGGCCSAGGIIGGGLGAFRRGLEAV
jgi:hypothetical protein